MSNEVMIHLYEEAIEAFLHYLHSNTNPEIAQHLKRFRREDDRRIIKATVAWICQAESMMHLEHHQKRVNKSIKDIREHLREDAIEHPLALWVLHQYVDYEYITHRQETDVFQWLSKIVVWADQHTRSLEVL